MTDTTTLDALDNITRLALEAKTWKVRATDAEAELNDILTAIDPDHTGALTASHAVRTVIRTLTRRAETAEAEVARLRAVLGDIAAMTDADDPESYRCDDREGCLDAVYAKAMRSQDAAGSLAQ